MTSKYEQTLESISINKLFLTKIIRRFYFGLVCFVLEHSYYAIGIVNSCSTLHGGKISFFIDKTKIYMEVKFRFFYQKKCLLIKC